MQQYTQSRDCGGQPTPRTNEKIGLHMHHRLSLSASETDCGVAQPRGPQTTFSGRKKKFSAHASPTEPQELRKQTAGSSSVENIPSSRRSRKSCISQLPRNTNIKNRDNLVIAFRLTVYVPQELHLVLAVRLVADFRHVELHRGRVRVLGVVPCTLIGQIKVAPQRTKSSEERRGPRKKEERGRNGRRLLREQTRNSLVLNPVYRQRCRCRLTNQLMHG